MQSKANAGCQELQNQLNSAQEELRGIKGKLDDENLGMGAAEKMHKEELLVYQQQIGDLQKERDDLLSKLNLQEQRYLDSLRSSWFPLLNYN